MGTEIGPLGPGGGGGGGGGGIDISLSGNTSGTLTLISSGTAILAGGNNITLSQVGQSITISGGAGGAFSGGVSGGNTSGNTGTVTNQLVLAGGNNITLSGSTGAGGMSATISAFNQSVQTQNLIDLSLSGNTAGALALVSSGTAIFAGGNNITLSQNAQSITISGPNTAAQTNQTLGLYAVSNTASTSTSTTLDARTLSFNAAGMVSVGYSAGSIVVSAAGAANSIGGNSTSAGAGYSNISTGTAILAGGNNITLSQNGATITISAPNFATAAAVPNFSLSAGNTSGVLALVSTGTLYFAGGNNVTLSQNGNSITVSAGGATLSRFYWPPFQFFPGGTTSNNVNSIYSLQYLPVDNYVSFSRIDIPVNMVPGSVANTSSAEGMYSAVLVLYSLAGSTFNPIVGASVSQTFIWQSTQTVWSNITGGRLFSFPIATLLSPGEYWAGFYISTTTSSTQTNLAFSVQMYMNQGVASGTFADFNSATNSTSNAQFVGALSSQPSNSTQTLQLSQFTFNSTQQARANVPLILRNY